MAKTAKQIAKILYVDDMGRADEVDVECDGGRAYDAWMRAAGQAGDMETVEDLESVDRGDFAEAWEALVQS